MRQTLATPTLSASPSICSSSTSSYHISPFKRDSIVSQQSIRDLFFDALPSTSPNSDCDVEDQSREEGGDVDIADVATLVSSTSSLTYSLPLSMPSTSPELSSITPSLSAFPSTPNTPIPILTKKTEFKREPSDPKPQELQRKRQRQNEAAKRCRTKRIATLASIKEKLRKSTEENFKLRIMIAELEHKKTGDLMPDTAVLDFLDQNKRW